MAWALTALSSNVLLSGVTLAGRCWLPGHHEDQPAQQDVAGPQDRSLKSKAVPRRNNLE